VTNLEKLLSITYANGSVQTFPLLAVTTTPFVELSAPNGERGCPALTFGVTHVSLSPSTSLEIWNPTEADAEWKIQHAPYKPPPATTAAGARARAALAAGEALPLDEPSAFVFDRMSGELAPRKGNVPERQPLSIQFTPKAGAGRYRSTFAIKVRHGMTAMLEVSAEATLREEDINVIGPDKHLRLMQLGELS